jgi:hypothetical protein
MKIRAALVVLCLSRLALADERTITLDRTCVEIDDTVDQLEPSNRELSMTLLRRVLERENLLVVTSGCTELYRVSHERVDDRFVIRLQSPAGKRRMTTPSLHELYAKYHRLTLSLLDAKTAAAEPIETTTLLPAAAVDPHDEPLAAELPVGGAPAHAPRWYGLFGIQVTGGVALTAGYRRDVQPVILDVTFTARAASGLSGPSLGAELLGDIPASENVAMYGGGGLSLGTFTHGTAYDSTFYSGGGVAAELTGGLRFGAGKRVEGMLQLDIMLPFYSMTSRDGGTHYGGTASLSGGIAW